MIQVAVGIIERDGRVLVCQRRRGSRYELKWEFPGGKVEAGEDPTTSLRRELSEELGITAEVGERIFRQTWVYPDHGEFDIRFFSVRRFSGEPRNLTFEDMRWMTPDTLAELDLLEGSKAVLPRLLRSL